LNLQEPAETNGRRYFFFIEAMQMLAEKFFLVLETLMSRGHPHDAPRVVSTSRHVPIKLEPRRGEVIAFQSLAASKAPHGIAK
jgi:hypothetical protein